MPQPHRAAGVPSRRRNLLTQSFAIERAPSQPNVGKLTIRVEDPPDAAGSRRVYLGISHGQHHVSLPGITVCQPRPGWINLQIPPVESWQAALAQLTAAERSRIAQPEFYEVLKTQIARRMPRETG